jgi:hypothetical protein
VEATHARVVALIGAADACACEMAGRPLASRPSRPRETRTVSGLRSVKQHGDFDGI